MTIVTSTRLIDFGYPAGWDVINVSVGPMHDPIVLLWKRPSDIALEPDEAEFPGISVERRFSVGPNRFRILHYRFDCMTMIELPTSNQSYRHVQPLSDDEYLLVAPDYDPRRNNADVVSVAGVVQRSWHLGPVQHVQTTKHGHFWIGYGDQAVICSQIGSAGAIWFDRDGQPRFTYNDYVKSQSLDGILDCYALNVIDDDDVWFWYYTEFPLVRVRNGQIAEYHPTMGEKAPIRGAGGFAVAGDRILFQGGFRDRESLYLVALTDQRSEELTVVDDAGTPIISREVFGRESRFYLRTEQALFVVDAATLPRWNDR